jgi:hypothetical protein
MINHGKSNAKGKVALKGVNQHAQPPTDHGVSNINLLPTLDDIFMFTD